MDKSTLSNYGWIVIAVLILSVMIALATPFGNYVKTATLNVTNGLIDTSDIATNNTFESLGVYQSTEQLQKKYKFSYYSTLSGAINDVTNDTVGENADSNQVDATAGIYKNNNDTIVVLLKNTTEAKRMKIYNDMTINLGGNTLTLNDDMAFDIFSGNLKIDGRIRGSRIDINRVDYEYAYGIQFRSGALTIDGGTYTITADSTAKGTVFINNVTTDAKTLNVQNATMNATAPSGIVCAIIGAPKIEFETNVSNSTISASSDTGNATAISMKAKNILNINNSNVMSISNANTCYGIQSVYRLNAKNCNVKGLGTSIIAYGEINIDGGLYEGNVYGAMYIMGSDTTGNIKNAKIKWCELPENCTNTTSSFISGITIGKDPNVSLYIDNCEIYAPKQPIILVGNNNAANYKLYISNSKINMDYTRKGIIIDSDTHIVYIGKGNNFTAQDTNRESSIVLTDEVYCQQ